MLDRVADVLRELLLATPPNVGGGVRALLDAWKVAKRFRALDLAGQRDVLDLFTKSAGDVLDRWFESAPIKAAFGFDAVVGNFASPYTPGSAYVLLHHVFGEVNGKRGQWGHARGGMGAITQAMAKECAARGVTLRTGAAVARVIVEAGRAAGVELASGEVVAGDARRRQRQSEAPVRAAGRARAPARRLPRAHRRLPLRLGNVPDERRAVRAARFHRAAGQGRSAASRERHRDRAVARLHGARVLRREDARLVAAPIVEVLIPSVVDDSLAPPGMHVASLFCQHVHPDLPRVAPGRTWDDARDEVADLMIDTVDRVAPNFRASVLGRRALSPLDLEREFGLIGGDIFHGALSLDQLFSARPVLGHGNYRAPVPGLYLCGAGTHPGGGVTGVPGHNAAREILKDVAAAVLTRAASARREPAGARSPEHRRCRRASPIRARIKPKSADKPGSVTALARYGRHSSRRTVAGALEPPTRGLGEQRRRPPTWCCSGWRLPRFTRRGVTRRRLVSVALFLAFVGRASGDL